MLEQRSDPDLKRWGFLFTEMVLIVASILLAFALDSWWDEKKDREEEVEILNGLKEEFLLNRAKLADRMEQHHADLAAMEELLAAIRRGAWTSTRLTLDESLAAMIAPPTTDPGDGVLNALISSGRFELLHNRQLRTRLAAWEGVFNEVADDELMSRALVFDRVIPYLVEHGIPVSGIMETWPGEWVKYPFSITDDPAAVARLLADPGFNSLLEARIGFKSHTTGEYDDAYQAVEEILAEIDRSLDARLD